MIQPGLKLTKTKDKAPTLSFLLPTINSTDRPLLTVSIGDITRFKGDAIVNTANHTLLGGAGVDGAIHKAAGPGLEQECRKIPMIKGERCPTGEARITRGYNLHASFVIHTVGPVYRSETQAKPLLEACYKNSLKLATAKGLETVAFPAISTGIYGYPTQKAAMVALTTIRDYFAKTETTSLKNIEFVLFPDKYKVWIKAAEEVLGPATHFTTGGRRSSSRRSRHRRRPAPGCLLGKNISIRIK